MLNFHFFFHLTFSSKFDYKWYTHRALFFFCSRSLYLAWNFSLWFFNLVSFWLSAYLCLSTSFSLEITLLILRISQRTQHAPALYTFAFHSFINVVLQFENNSMHTFRTESCHFHENFSFVFCTRIRAYNNIVHSFRINKYVSKCVYVVVWKLMS